MTVVEQTPVDSWRGHAMFCDVHGQWRYTDTEQLVSEHVERDCAQCGQASTIEGHDACLGELPGVVNACCGHGDEWKAYVVLENGERLGGREAQDWFDELVGVQDHA